MYPSLKIWGYFLTMNCCTLGCNLDFGELVRGSPSSYAKFIQMPKSNEFANKVKNSSHVSTSTHDTGKENVSPNMETNEYITHKPSADKVKTAGISKETRDLLSIMGMFIDANEAFNNWVEVHGYVSDERIEEFGKDFSKMYSTLETALLARVFESLNTMNFENI